MRFSEIMQIPFMCSLFLLCGCSAGDGGETAAVTLAPLQETEETEDLFPYMERLETIEIDDDDRLLFSDAAKMLTDKEGRIFVLDYAGNLVAMNPDGTFFRRMANRGRASNEYASIMDIALTDDDLIILDGQKARFFSIPDPGRSRYSDISVEAPCDAVAPAGEGGVWLFSAFPADVRMVGQTDSLLFLLDKDGNHTSSFIPRKDCTFSISNISQSCGNTYYLRPQDNRHVFYRLSDAVPEPAYRIDFGEKTIPDRYYYEAADEDIMKYMTSDYYKLPMELHETSSHLYFRAAGPEASDCMFIYDRETHRGIRWSDAAGSVNFPVRILTSDSDWFYAVFPETVPGIDARGGLLYDSILSGLESAGKDPASGPYIVRIKFRRF